MQQISGLEAKEVCAFTGTQTFKYNVDDSGMLLMKMNNGAIAMVDANVQREEILASERAFSLKMKLDAIKRQGKRNDLTSCLQETKLGSDEIVGQGEGLARAQVHRYIRLTELIPKLLDMVDEKRLALSVAVEISYLNKNFGKRTMKECIAYVERIKKSI